MVPEARPDERGKGGKVFPDPATFGGPRTGPQSLKNTENGVPDCFLLT